MHSFIRNLGGTLGLAVSGTIMYLPLNHSLAYLSHHH